MSRNLIILCIALSLGSFFLGIFVKSSSSDSVAKPDQEINYKQKNSSSKAERLDETKLTREERLAQSKAELKKLLISPFVKSDESLYDLLEENPELLEYLKQNYADILPELNLGRNIESAAVFELFEILGHDDNQQEFYNELLEKRPDIAIHDQLVQGLVESFDNLEDKIDFMAQLKDDNIFYITDLSELESPEAFTDTFAKLGEKVEDGKTVFDVLPVNYFKEWVKHDLQGATEALANDGVRAGDFNEFVDSYIQRESVDDVVATLLEMYDSQEYHSGYVASGMERALYRQPQATREAIERLESSTHQEIATKMIEMVENDANLSEGFDPNKDYKMENPMYRAARYQLGPTNFSEQ